ncbi:MAG: hypothetical protein Tsb0014_30680 [Pleurocapsa sp.]
MGLIKDSTTRDLLISVALAGLVILLFLEDFRATAIVMISIPTTLALSMLPFIPFSMSLNSSTLVGMMMAIGKLVDDSIIVIDSIDHKLKEGKTPQPSGRKTRTLRLHREVRRIIPPIDSRQTMW